MVLARLLTKCCFLSSSERLVEFHILWFGVDAVLDGNVNKNETLSQRRELTKNFQNFPPNNLVIKY